MTANHNELLSALVDGELQGAELDQAVQLLAMDEQAKQQLQRYQLSSDVLHGHGSVSQYFNLDERVSLEIVDEITYSLATATHQTAQILSLPPQFWKQTASLAIAAAVGALAVVGVITTQPQNKLMPAIPLVAIEAPIVTATDSSNRWTVTEQEVAERLNAYLSDHNEYVGESSVFSYARVVSYDMGQ